MAEKVPLPIILRVVFFVFLVISVSCISGGRRVGDSADNSQAPIMVNRDSIYIKIDTAGSQKNRGGISLFDSKGLQTIVSESTDFRAYFFDAGSSFLLYTIPNEAIFPINPGDSVIVFYTKDRYPEIQVLNNDTYSNDELNFSVVLARKSKSIFEYKFRQLANDPQYHSYVDTYQSGLYLLDSCKNIGIIGEEYADWISKQMKYTYYSLKMNSETENNTIRVRLSKKINQPNLFYYWYYREFLRDFANNYGSPKQGVDTLLANVDRIFEGKERDFILFRTAYIHLLNQSTIETRQRILRVIKPKFQDLSYYDALHEQFPTAIQTNRFGKDGIFDLENAEYDIPSLLGTLYGNLVYIDFWASWCVPCRVEMPASKALKNKLNEEDVIFLYISLDQSHTQWVTANRAESISSRFSYRLADPKNANIIQDLKVDKIPRYVLIGKDGHIISDDAFKPSDERLEEIITNAL